MATSTPRRARPVRTLVALAILIALLFGALIAGNVLDAKSAENTDGASLTPGLALDLEGGTQIILAPVSADKSKVTTSNVNQAIAVIRQRIDSSGVAEAEITSQGSGRNAKIVVGIPGAVSQETLDLVEKSALMLFRPLLVEGAPGVTPADEAGDSPTTSPSDAATPTDGATAAAPDGAQATPTEGAGAAGDDAKATPSEGASAPATPTAKPTDPSDPAWITPAIQKQFDDLDCTKDANLVGGESGVIDQPFVACDQTGRSKYILGPVDVKGVNIKNANSGKQQAGNVTTREWVVNVRFDGQGTKDLARMTKRITALEEPRNRFAMVLDGLVISSPTTESIPNGQAVVSGDFTRQSAATLANQLNFGALPLSFETESRQQISATLGSEQLEKGLIAGLIGMLLVVIYSLLQYRMLGFVTVASLLIAAVITYGVIDLLSWVQGYRLSLPGVAGLIVAIGITADSFIVYFERVRDQLRDGRPLGAAVERGWARARRTILASDTVNFLAAVVLYSLAVGGVRGFAYTLGLTTLVDLVVVFMFTHPMLQLLSRTKFFAEGHRASGLDPRLLGVSTTRYVGRGRFERTPGAAPTTRSAVGDAPAVEDAPVVEEAPVGAGPAGPSVAERMSVRVGAPAATAGGNGTGGNGTGRRMTIAERRAAEKRAAGGNPQASDEPAGADRVSSENEDEH